MIDQGESELEASTDETEIETGGGDLEDDQQEEEVISEAELEAELEKSIIVEADGKIIYPWQKVQTVKERDRQ